jgi:lipoyl(octanoyl) transferase
MDGRPLTVALIPEAPYRRLLTLQRLLHSRMKEHETIGPFLLVCRHEPVVTAGKSTNPESEHEIETWCAQKNVLFERIERGGSITYHGPEQIVVYPLLRLSTFKCDVGWYVRALEETLIQTLAMYHVVAHRREKLPGVWVTDSNGLFKKIGFIGVKLSRWCTFHGMSLSLSPCSEPFSHMDPCGLSSVTITSLNEETKSEHSWGEIASKVVESFCKVLQIDTVIYESLSSLESLSSTSFPSYSS